MCPHNWIKVDEVTVCTRCGLTRLADGRILFDRKLPNYKQKPKRKGKKK